MPVNENLCSLTIYISPAFDVQGVRQHGLSFADLDGRQLCIFRRPLLDGSRVLLAEGIDPATPIATRNAGADFDAKMSTVGAASGLTVSERNTRSASFVPYKAFSRADIEPSLRFDERPAPDTGQGVERKSDGRAAC